MRIGIFYNRLCRYRHVSIVQHLYSYACVCVMGFKMDFPSFRWFKYNMSFCY